MLFISLTIAALTSIGAARQCTNYTIPLSVSARNAVFNLATPSSPVDVTNFALDLTRQGHNLTNELLTGVSGTAEKSIFELTFVVQHSIWELQHLSYLVQPRFGSLVSLAGFDPWYWIR